MSSNWTCELFLKAHKVESESCIKLFSTASLSACAVELHSPLKSAVAWKYDVKWTVLKVFSEAFSKIPLFPFASFFPICKCQDISYTFEIGQNTFGNHRNWSRRQLVKGFALGELHVNAISLWFCCRHCSMCPVSPALLHAMETCMAFIMACWSECAFDILQIVA